LQFELVEPEPQPKVNVASLTLEEMLADPESSHAKDFVDFCKACGRLDEHSSSWLLF